MTTLGFERGTSATTGYRRFEKELEGITELAKANGKADDPRIRQGLAHAWSKVQIMKVNGLRSLSVGPDREEGPRRGRPRGHQQDVLVRVPPGRHGAGHGDRRHGRARSSPATPRPRRRCRATAPARTNEEYPASVLQSAFFFSRSETIWGGTAQIQRNIVGERVLGLPKEPRPG